VSDGETTTRYMCVAREHVNGDGLSHGHFTVWQGTWGYCPSQRPGDGHEWQAISDVLHGSPEEISHRIRHYLQTHLAGEAANVVESVPAR
jgi:hypothetical protein